MTATESSYVVICRDDVKPDGSPGDYVLATRRVFENAKLAQEYAGSINASRAPLVVEGDWKNLRYLGQRTERTLVVSYIRGQQQCYREESRDTACALESLANEIEGGVHRRVS